MTRRFTGTSMSAIAKVARFIMAEQFEPLATAHSFARRGFTSCHPCRSHDVSASSALTKLHRGAGGRAVTNKSALAEFPLDEIDLLVGWHAGEDEYLFTKAVDMVREWLLGAEEKDCLRNVLKEILAEAGPPAGNRPLD